MIASKGVLCSLYSTSRHQGYVGARQGICQVVSVSGMGVTCM
jgi:hypothetical protein